MGGGKERRETQRLQTDLGKQQVSLGNEFLNLSRQELGRRNELQQPGIDFYKNIISGDPNARLTAAATPLADISRSARRAKEEIYNTAPRGAARDFALSQVPQQSYAQSADLLNKTYLSAFPALSQYGSESGNMSLQQAGAGLRGIEGGINTNKSVMDNQQQQKASTMNLLGGLAGTAGTIATGGTSSLGGLFNKKKSGDMYL